MLKSDISEQVNTWIIIHLKTLSCFTKGSTLNFLKQTIFRTVLGLQEDWEHSMESSHIPHTVSVIINILQVQNTCQS